MKDEIEGGNSGKDGDDQDVNDHSLNIDEFDNGY
jgi:hypothetical protein